MTKPPLRGSPERRSLSTPFEARAASDSELRLTGYASVFNNPYPIFGGPKEGGFDETVDARAFEQTLRGKPDLHLLINHEGMPLARTKSGTLNLSTDKHGLLVDASLDRQDPDVQRLERKMLRRDIDEMSFAFRTIRDEYRDYDDNVVDYFDPAAVKRTLLEVSLDKGDVSVVNFGANPATSTELQRALRALSSADDGMLAEVRAKGVNLAGAQRNIGRLLAREAQGKRALDPDDVNMLTQAMGWFTAIDSIVDGVVEGDPELQGVDLATLIASVDTIVDEAQEAIAAYLGVPTPDPDDADGDEPRSRKWTYKVTDMKAGDEQRKPLSIARALQMMEH